MSLTVLFSSGVDLLELPGGYVAWLVCILLLQFVSLLLVDSIFLPQLSLMKYLCLGLFFTFSRIDT